MNENTRHIIRYLFGAENLEEVSLGQLMELVEEYPSFSAGHYLLSKKMQEEKNDGFFPETQRTALYFNNPFWLQWLLQSTGEAQPQLAPEKEYTPESDGYAEPGNETIYEATVYEEMIITQELPQEETVAPTETAFSPEIMETAHHGTIEEEKKEPETPAFNAHFNDDAYRESPVAAFSLWANEPAKEEASYPTLEKDGANTETADEPALPVNDDAGPEPAAVTSEPHNSTETDHSAEAPDPEPAAQTESSFVGESTPDAVAATEQADPPVCEEVHVAEAGPEPAPASSIRHFYEEMPDDIPSASAVTHHSDIPSSAGEEPPAENHSGMYADASIKNFYEEIPDHQETESTTVTVQQDVPPAESTAETSQPVPAETAPAAEAQPAEAMPSSEPAQPHPEEHEPALVFEPYHTVDYFASQGIRFVPDENAGDRFSRQLKSFTDWLKAMKKLPHHPAPANPEENPEDAEIQRIAAHSIEEKDVVTEAMAEVLAKQEKVQEAIDLYLKLSLLNPTKIAYFASKIEAIKKAQP